MRGNVLVVEDDDKIRRLLVDYFEQHSHLTVSGARDGADALHEIAMRSVDVVVLDLMMPYMSGVDVLVSLATLAHDASTGRRMTDRPAVIVITAASQEDVPTDEIQQRFSDFVRCVHRKPLELSDLAACVEKQLAARAALPSAT